MSEENGAGESPIGDDVVEKWVRDNSQSTRDTDMTESGEKNGPILMGADDLSPNQSLDAEMTTSRGTASGNAK